MASDYQTMITRAFALHSERVLQARTLHLQEIQASQAATGFLGRSSHQAEFLGKAIVRSNLAITKELLAKIDQIISTGGEDVPPDAAEKLSGEFNELLGHFKEIPVAAVNAYLGDNLNMARMVSVRFRMMLNAARMEIEQEIGLLVRKHRSQIGPRAMREETHPDGALRMNRMVQPVHFEDFSGKQFERLVFAYVLRGGWPKAEWLGEAGSDGGQDILCANGEGQTTVFLCANFKRLNYRKAQADLQKIEDGKYTKPDNVIVVAGGLVSLALREKIKAKAVLIGAQSCEVWSGTELEERIRKAESHLLDRFCRGEPFPETPEELRAFGAPESRSNISRAAKQSADIDFDPGHLSDDAKRLLFEMSQTRDGYVLRSRSHDGYGLVIGGKSFVPTTPERRIEAKWERVLTELAQAQLITAEGSSGDIFVVTADGYEAVEECGLIPR